MYSLSFADAIDELIDEPNEQSLNYNPYCKGVVEGLTCVLRQLVNMAFAITGVALPAITGVNA